MQWSPPDKDTPNKATIQIFVSTYRAGFVSNERTASSKEKIQEEFDLVTRSAQRKENNSSYSEVKKLKVSGVEGVFYVMRFNFEDKDRGLREEINWTAYRIYQGKAAKIDINIGASPKSDDLLRTIFSTLEILDEITLRNRAVDDPALTNHRRTIRSGQEIQLTTSAWPCGTV